MGRLTKKAHHYCDTDVDNEYTFADRDTNVEVLVDKLGLFEDIEERFGIDLVTLFKALENGIYKKDEDLCFEATLRIKRGEIYLCQPYDCELLHKVLVKDYKKTWWLREDKSE